MFAADILLNNLVNKIFKGTAFLIQNGVATAVKFICENGCL